MRHDSTALTPLPLLQLVQMREDSHTVPGHRLGSSQEALSGPSGLQWSNPLWVQRQKAVFRISLVRGGGGVEGEESHHPRETETAARSQNAAVAPLARPKPS